MALIGGSRLGAYEIEAAIGAGGMGEVYRARDTKLNRRVAIKVLPDSFARDGERIARFRREAQLLAALNHPHIAAIHDLHEADGHQFLVLELIDGETLAERIAKGPLSVDETIAIARQIAEALEAAHEKGIVHRDLKPANIAMTADDQVKVLDFGLAKASGVSPSSGPNLENSPTITSPDVMTGAGLILGTAAYMSPEQTKGRVADKRSDVWSFGCVLYEMLAGRRPFHGDDVSDTLAAVLKGQPDWKALPSDVPPGVRALVEGCLRKDRRERIGDLSTARFLLDQPHVPLQAAVGRPPSRLGRNTLVAAGVLASAGIAAYGAWKLKPSPAAAVTRFAFTLPQGQLLTLTRPAVTISPDGSRMVYAADGRLYLRSMSGFESRPIPGAEPAISPVFSPDGESLLFWSDGIKRIAVTGGPAVPVCQLDSPPAGITWTNEAILFSDLRRGIMRVSPDGGKPEQLVPNTSEDLVYGPQLLPGGRAVLFGIVKQTAAAIDRWDEAQIVVQSLATGDRKTLVESGTQARYVQTGHLVYMSGGTLFAVPFDLDRLETTSRAVPVIEGVRRGAGRAGGAGLGHFAFSDTGSLIYVPGPPGVEQSDLVLFDRKGGTEALTLPPARYDFPRVSPDGKRIAFETNAGKEAVISIYPLSGASSVRRLTFGGNARFPTWASDRRLAFQSDREGDPAVFWQSADGGNAERLTKPDRGASHAPESWSPDGEVLLFSEKKGLAYALWTFSLRDRKATPFDEVQGSTLPSNASFSHDGRWVAYQMSQGGMAEGITFVQPFPPTGTKHEIGQGGRPLWSRDGKELFFIPAPGRFLAFTVSTQPSFTFTRPAAVPRVFAVAHPANPRPFDLLPDGRFVGVGVADPGPGGPQIHVVLNWHEELKRLVPKK